MSNTKTKYYTVYNMKYAIELKKMGHKVAETVPNPQKPYLISWVFEVDETFYSDFMQLKGGARNDRR